MKKGKSKAHTKKKKKRLAVKKGVAKKGKPPNDIVRVGIKALSLLFVCCLPFLVEIYQQKLQQCLADEKLSDDDVKPKRPPSAFFVFIVEFKQKRPTNKSVATVGKAGGEKLKSSGECNRDRKIDDLKLLYRAYVTDSLSNGRMEENKLAALNQLKSIFALWKREAEAITMDVTSKVYRKLLAQAVSNGGLEAAESKSAFLQNASEIHEEIYLQKLQQCLAGEKLSDVDVKAVLHLRVLLCAPQKTVEAAHTDICGTLFEKTVRDAIASGVDGYDADVKASMRNAAQSLCLTREAAMSIASTKGRADLLKDIQAILHNLLWRWRRSSVFHKQRSLMFIALDPPSYSKQAKAAGSRTESVKILMKMITFNKLVVSTLNDLLACDKAVSAEPLSWDMAEEWADLFGIYMKNELLPEKLLCLQYLLGISHSTATALREMGDKVPGIRLEAEEFVF